MNRIRLVLGFRNGGAVWSDGQFGGVVMFWEVGLDVRLLSKSRYHVDVKVFTIDELDVRWRLTVFYGHPSASEGTGGMILHFRSEFAVNVQNILMRRFRLLSFRCIRPSLLDRMLLKEVNYTHVCLIPKVLNPTQVSDLRPIALCNVRYKICSKVIANRLKVHLSSIISPCRSVFIPGRLITDNSLVANEIFHFINIDESVGVMSLKLDMSEAYDQAFSKLLDSKVEQGVLQGISVYEEALVVNHLLFADDSLLFDQLQAQFACILGVGIVEKHGKYLGLSTVVGRNRTVTFSYIKEQVSNKLEGWSGKLLSSARKDILIRVVAQALPSYAISCFLLPKTFCNTLHQMCAKFWWGSSAENNKIHWKNEVWGSVIYFWNAPAPIRPSSCWKSIIEAKDLLSNRAQWKIGNGMLVDAWEDPWLPRPRDFRLIGRHSTRLSKVSEFITPNRYWDVKLLEEHFEVADVTLILTIPLNHHSCSDKLIWLYDSKGRRRRRSPSATHSHRPPIANLPPSRSVHRSDLFSLPSVVTAVASPPVASLSLAVVSRQSAVLRANQKTFDNETEE
ncbi:hypothetical protein ACLB2K_004580 [Fragaria x ananassa]